MNSERRLRPDPPWVCELEIFAERLVSGMSREK